MAPTRLWKIGLPSQLLVLLLVVVSTAQGNTPPTISMDRDWQVQENEPIGSVVTRVKSQDTEGDEISFRIDKSSVGDDGSYLFDIDEHGVVRVAKSLEGLGHKNFYVSVVGTDGQFTARVDARVLIGNIKGKSTQGGLFAALNPHAPPIGIPTPYSGLNHQLIHGSRGRLPTMLHVNNPEPVGGPPILQLPSPALWEVRSSATVNSWVGEVGAISLSRETYYFTLEDERGIIAIDPQTGEVTVKKPLENEIGQHFILIQVTNRYGTADGEMVLKVVAAPESANRSSTTPQPDPAAGATTVHTDHRPTLIAIIKNGPTPPPTTTSPTPDEGYGATADTTADGGLSVLGVVLIALATSTTIVVGPLLYCCCCRSSKTAINRKESTVKYDKKGLELSPASSAASSLSRQQSLVTTLPQVLRFWQRRASQNKYESGQAPAVAVTPRPASVKDSTTSVASDPTDEWEFPRHKLKVLSILGEGCFGQVWKYEATDLHGPEGEKTYVAVKTLKESAGHQERKDLQQELKVLKGLGKHPNVVSLLACCTEKEPTLLVLEYLIHGKLQTYLRDRRSKQPYNNLHGSSSTLSPRDLTIFALQVAKGMDYLSCHGIVHRDLAARNVLVGEDKVCKVADFGFARDVANNHVYERKSDGRLPIRWMAVESLFDNIFTCKTDVWSFGILLWEIVTLGSTPYPGMSAEEVMKRIKEGYRLEKPGYCKREVYNIMYYCWYEDPKERPTFKELIKLLEGLITSEVDYIELNNFPDRCYYNIKLEPASGELL